MRSEDDEIARLRRELKRVTDERDFQKKRRRTLPRKVAEVPMHSAAGAVTSPLSQPSRAVKSCARAADCECSEYLYKAYRGGERAPAPPWFCRSRRDHRSRSARGSPYRGASVRAVAVGPWSPLQRAGLMQGLSQDVSCVRFLRRHSSPRQSRSASQPVAANAPALASRCQRAVSA